MDGVFCTTGNDGSVCGTGTSIDGFGGFAGATVVDDTVGRLPIAIIDSVKPGACGQRVSSNGYCVQYCAAVSVCSSRIRWDSDEDTKRLIYSSSLSIFIV